MEAIVNKQQAIYTFFSGFGIPAYAATSVPDSSEYPYLTYDLVVGSYFEGETSITASLWYRGDSESEPNAKVNEISAAVGNGTIIPCDDGGIWIRRGSPWVQSMGDSADDKVKRRVLNFTVEYLTTI